MKLLGAVEKPFYAAVDPLVAWLIRSGVRPNTITTIGTGLVLISAVVYATGHIRIGGLLLLLSGVADTLDGQVARGGAMVTRFGAFYDSTLDRVGDAAIFGGLVLYFAGAHENGLGAGFALACLILGFVVSYSKARAEGLGMTANVGIAERADRLLAALLATFLVGLGVSVVLLVVVLGLLSVASVVTIVQRMVAVRRQALARTPHGTPDQHSPGVSTP